MSPQAYSAASQEEGGAGQLTLAGMWANVVDGFSPVAIEATGTLMVQLLCFYMPCLIYHWLPTVLPAFCVRHKLQPKERQPSRREVWQCFRVVMQNQLLTTSLQVLLWRRSGWKPTYTVDKVRQHVAECPFTWMSTLCSLATLVALLQGLLKCLPSPSSVECAGWPTYK